MLQNTVTLSSADPHRPPHTHPLLKRLIFPPSRNVPVSEKQPSADPNKSYAHAVHYPTYERNLMSIRNRNSLLSPKSLKSHHEYLSSYYSSRSRLNGYSVHGRPSSR